MDTVHGTALIAYTYDSVDDHELQIPAATRHHNSAVLHMASLIKGKKKTTKKPRSRIPAECTLHLHLHCVKSQHARWNYHKLGDNLYLKLRILENKGSQMGHTRLISTHPCTEKADVWAGNHFSVFYTFKQSLEYHHFSPSEWERARFL